MTTPLICVYKLTVLFTFDSPTMGVDHGGQGKQVPPEFRVGYANANCPPSDFCHIGTKRSVRGLQKMPTSVFGRSSATPLGELKTIPQTPSRLERGHPSTYPTPLGTDPPSPLTMRSHRIPARSMPMSPTHTCRPIA